MAKKIMVVDDEPDILVVIEKILGKEGYDVVTTNSGEECLNIIEKEMPDLVLLDVMMPGIDGWETCRRIKENEKTKNVLVAMLTVKFEDEDKVKSLERALADWHISKPIESGRLVKTVKWLLKTPMKRKEAKKIMLVDDEPDVLSSMEKILEKEGYDVVTTNSGEECLNIIEKEMPDLVLLDVMMPGIDGWETCRRIKENEKTKHIVVTMLTVKTEEKDKEKSLDKAKADWHIDKPVKREALLRAIEWLGKTPPVK